MAIYDIAADIERLKKEKNAVILAHYYEDGDIQDIADHVLREGGARQQARRSHAGSGQKDATAGVLRHGQLFHLVRRRRSCTRTIPI